MKKLTATKFFAVAAAAVIMAGAFTGCSVNINANADPNLEMEVENNAASIKFNNADKDDSVSAGAIEIGENDELVVEPAFDEGSAKVSLSKEPEEESEDVLPKEGDTVFEAEFDENGEQSFFVEPGSYMVTVTATSKSNGTMLVRVREQGTAGYELFTKVASAEEAAKGAGVDSFELPMDAETDLGKVSDAAQWMNFRYITDTAQADFPMGAAGLVVRKGLFSTSDNGDVSGDYMEYTKEWTQDVDGIEVKCYGMRDGAAMKSIWTVGDYSYSITARGEGGDDEFGLSENDVAVWVRGVK